MDYKRYKLLFGLQINRTDTFTSFSVPGSRDKWRHLWLQDSHTSYRLVLSAQKHVQFALAAQRGEQTASLKKTRNQERFVQKIAVTPGLGGKLGNLRVAKRGERTLTSLTKLEKKK